MEVSSTKGKKAVTNYKTLEIFDNDNSPTLSLLECKLETGRTHQIRLQGQEIGHPVVNDDKYGDREFNKKDILKKNKRMGLHSQIIEFKDQNNKTIKVKAEPDSSFKSLIELLS